MMAEARRLSPAISASLAKSVSTSASLADFRDSSSLISSNLFLSSIGTYNKKKKILYNEYIQTLNNNMTLTFECNYLI